MATQSVEITKDCTIDGEPYAEGSTPELTPFQARSAINAGAAKRLPDAEPETPPTPSVSPAKKKTPTRKKRA